MVRQGKSDRQAIGLFLVLSYLIAWSWWIPMLMRGDRTSPGNGWPTHLPGLMAPSIAAFVVSAVSDGRDGIRRLSAQCVKWRFDWRAYALTAVFAMLAFMPVVTGIATTKELSRYSGAPSLGIWVLLVVLFVNGFGEEVGWRGFLAKILLRTHSIAYTSTVISVVWGLWHLPLFFIVNSYRDFGVGGILGWSVGLWFGSVFLVWLYQFTQHSILAVVLWHVAYNFGVATDAAKGVYPGIVTSIVVVFVVVIMRKTQLQESRHG